MIVYVELARKVSMAALLALALIVSVAGAGSARADAAVPLGATAEADAPAGVQGDPACRVVGDKTAVPHRILLGETVRVELSLAFECPANLPEVDIVLAVDRSGSMAGDALRQAIAAARDFVGRLEAPQHRVAVVSFAEDVTIDCEMSHGLGRAHQALGWLQADGRTNLAGGLRSGLEVLQARSRPGARQVVIVLTDGVDTVGGDPVSAAAEIRDNGVTVYCIGLGHVDHDVLRQVATTPDAYYHAPTPDEIAPIYEALVAPVTAPAPGDVVVHDVLAADIDFVDGSDQPEALVADRELTWPVGDRPNPPLLLTYRARPTRTGLLPVNDRAVALYTDVDGVRREFVFPVPYVEVVAPTPTPTATPVPTPRPLALYLPCAIQNRCQVKDVPVDVVLLMDVSGSMGEMGKLQAARRAAGTFLTFLHLGADRAAVVSFSDDAKTLVELTDNDAALRHGLDQLVAWGMTHMHLGLDESRAAIDRGGRPTGHQAVVILLSDGLPSDEYRVQQAARTLKDSGALLFAIGFGPDADMQLLTEIASNGIAFPASDADQLQAVYEQIARQVICR